VLRNASICCGGRSLYLFCDRSIAATLGECPTLNALGERPTLNVLGERPRSNGFSACPNRRPAGAGYASSFGGDGWALFGGPGRRTLGEIGFHARSASSAWNTGCRARGRVAALAHRHRAQDPSGNDASRTAAPLGQPSFGVLCPAQLGQKRIEVAFRGLRLEARCTAKDQTIGRLKNGQTGSATHAAGRLRELRLTHPKPGATVRAFGDQWFDR
jgi:hypothetical protein